MEIALIASIATLRDGQPASSMSISTGRKFKIQPLNEGMLWRHAWMNDETAYHSFLLFFLAKVWKNPFSDWFQLHRVATKDTSRLLFFLACFSNWLPGWHNTLLCSYQRYRKTYNLRVGPLREIIINYGVRTFNDATLAKATRRNCLNIRHPSSSFSWRRNSDENPLRFHDRVRGLLRLRPLATLSAARTGAG